MIDLQTLMIFIPIGLALNLTPGADMLFCLGQGLKSGPRAGVAASCGISVGSLIYSALAGLGLAALIAANPLAFEAIRWAGVAYLVWLAVGTLRAPLAAMQPADVARGSAFKAFRTGILVNLTNPKVALFILALVPQFVDPARGPVLVQFMLFGLILSVGGTVINGMVGAFAGQIGQGLARKVYLARGLQYATSFVFLGLAAKLALERR